MRRAGTIDTLTCTIKRAFANKLPLYLMLWTPHLCRQHCGLAFCATAPHITPYWSQCWISLIHSKSNVASSLVKTILLFQIGRFNCLPQTETITNPQLLHFYTYENRFYHPCAKWIKWCWISTWRSQRLHSLKSNTCFCHNTVWWHSINPHGSRNLNYDLMSSHHHCPTLKPMELCPLRGGRTKQKWYPITSDTIKQILIPFPLHKWMHPYPTNSSTRHHTITE